MSEDGFAGPAPERPVPGLRDFAFVRKADVVLSRDAFEPLRQGAPTPSREAEPFASGSVRKVLRAHRRRAGLTLAQLPGRAGIALESPSPIETGRIHPTVATFATILRALKQGAGA